MLYFVVSSELILLQSMRFHIEDADPAIWIDALCIDQIELVERSSQVTLMGGTFARAREMIVGLSSGRDSDDKSVLVDLANSISPFTRSTPIKQT